MVPPQLTSLNWGLLIQGWHYIMLLDLFRFILISNVPARISKVVFAAGAAIFVDQIVALASLAGYPAPGKGCPRLPEFGQNFQGLHWCFPYTFAQYIIGILRSWVFIEVSWDITIVSSPALEHGISPTYDSSLEIWGPATSTKPACSILVRISEGILPQERRNTFRCLRIEKPRINSNGKIDLFELVTFRFLDLLGGLAQFWIWECS